MIKENRSHESNVGVVMVVARINEIIQISSRERVQLHIHGDRDVNFRVRKTAKATAQINDPTIHPLIHDEQSNPFLSS